VIGEFLEKIEELVDRSKGKVRADKVHEKITAMGFKGSRRVTRRAVARAKQAWHAGRRRIWRPWVAEPGMWAQYDFGDGPETGGAATVLFCLWVAWSRFRVVIPILDKTQASVWAGCDAAFRRLGGVPAYLLAGNEKTVTVEHVAGIPVRNLGAVEFGRHYGLTVATCVPYDPASKGGSESTVKVATAGLVPTDANLREAYGSFAELEAACAAFCEEVNAREHRITRRVPAEMIAAERARLHPVRAAPFTAALGVTRRVDMISLVRFEGGQCCVPHQLAGQAVHVRGHGEHVVIAHARPAGASRVRAKMSQAVQLAVPHGAQAVDRTLGQAAAAGRFADGDLASILAHQASAAPGETSRAGEDRTLAQARALGRRARRRRRAGDRPRRHHRARRRPRRGRPGAGRLLVPAGLVRRERRPGPVLPGHPPRPGRVPYREDL
jgi:hypothetical protein